MDRRLATPESSRCRSLQSLLVLALGCILAKQVGGANSGKQVSNKLCPGTKFRIGDKTVGSFDELSRFFARYSIIPKIDSTELVAVELDGAPCGPFATNMTFYMRAGTVDVRRFRNVFQHQLFKFTKTLFKRPPKAILDLGAHVGMSTMYFASSFPNATVVAVEPQLYNFALMRLNSAQFGNVHLEYGAAWDRTATVKVGHRRSDARRSLWQRFVIDVIDFNTGRLGEIVPALEVAEIMKKYQWTEIDYVKADMEGAEQVVFGDPRAMATWLGVTKCFSVKLYDQPASSISKLVEPKFVKRLRTGDVQVWCRADLTV